MSSLGVTVSIRAATTCCVHHPRGQTFGSSFKAQLVNPVNAFRHSKRSKKKLNSGCASGHVRVEAAVAFGSSTPEKEIDLYKTDHLVVGDVMTKGNLITVRSDTTVYEALELLVENRITGMPVVDEDDKIIGVVSDYDLLALDSISGKLDSKSDGIFPAASSTWKAFKEIQKLLIKTRGQVVSDVMTSSPVVVRPMTNLEDAARILLQSKFRRLPVCDETGRLVGLLTRGNVVRAALMMKRALDSSN